MSKLEQLKNLYEKYNKEFHDKEIVMGDGNTDARILLIGEAPGKDEVRLGRPFVGMAGKNLDEFLNVLEVERESIFITNAIKYRLSKINVQTGRTVNRPALKEEINANREYLLREVEILDPEYIATLGNVPLRAITGDSNISIGDAHGKLRTMVLSDREYPLFPLYHPASVIYNRALKEIYLNDLRRFRQIIL